MSRTVYSIGEALAYEARQGIVPIAIRPDLTVRVHGIPADLSRREAEKIAAVVMAYADGERTASHREG